ncbi:MAG: hypothetical protein JW910_01420, partial [Anaerolineae bacterium]|nr:hypothetical protein [Anaerolineae bacterium]
MTDMTDAIIPDRAVEADRVQALLRVYVSVEALVYLLLAVLVLVMRLTDLDIIALGQAEAHEALAAWHAVRLDAPGTAPLSNSPIMFLLNSITFTAFGASDLAARLMTALGGSALVFLPLLWRRELDRVSALTASLLLTFSASALVGARTMSPVIWAMLLAVVGLRLVVQFA